MNRRHALKLGLTVPFVLAPALADERPKFIEPESQDNLLVMTLDTYSRITELIDKPQYLDEDQPFIWCSERLGDTYIIEWHEWKSLHDKLKWEEILNEVI